MKVLFTSLIAVTTLVLLTACGTPGAPQPPSLQLARSVLDLTATRKGDVVTLTWTPPAQTTDGQNIRAKYAGPTYVCRTVNGKTMLTCQYSVGNVPVSIPGPQRRGERRAPELPKVQFMDKLPPSLQEQHPVDFVVYAVEVTNFLGRSAGLSNYVQVPLAPTFAPPRQIETRVTADGIEVGFACPAVRPIRGLQYAAHLYRRDPAGNIAQVGLQPLPANTCSITDSNFEWEKTYSYWVTEVTTVLRHGREVASIAGDDSPSAELFTHDVFPPAVPTGVEAVASGVGQKPFVDLTWTPNTDADLDGYYVFRQEAGTGNWVRLNANPVRIPAYRDVHVQAEKTYAYAVSAADVRRNESGRSTETSETVP